MSLNKTNYFGFQDQEISLIAEADNMKVFSWSRVGHAVSVRSTHTA
jgi:Na+-transporting NADH:ubiquinone oxidoreductase subunit NqrA